MHWTDDNKHALHPRTSLIPRNGSAEPSTLPASKADGRVRAESGDFPDFLVVTAVQRGKTRDKVHGQQGAAL